MLADILTWVGAALGITVLTAMAFGGVALDYGERRGARRARGSNTPAP
ncbi:hypothetical protein [Saccharomonospora glauca]|jgi:hypothetical protein|uniref:Uncharacterized protein n=1 Tax=Saccharomonospora glauca K62 TaxID=928724 RepID=I1CWQ9_9PSEU|nr:hypothetical protein [Saccharomonospora glauca]EIE97133.1 hypothetical protein SacglDRAFT_00170 [Saccharomonospora glauca K62]